MKRKLNFRDIDTEKYEWTAEPLRISANKSRAAYRFARKVHKLPVLESRAAARTVWRETFLAECRRIKAEGVTA